jgi:hypothetical protein
MRFVWQSSIQKAYTRDYSDIIYLDCMKKRANTIAWPYIAPVVLDGDKKIGTMTESIICSERLDAYKFVVLAAFAMANANIKGTKIIFGDGIMGDSLLEDLGIADTCKLCHDEYHLIMKDWLRQFGPPPLGYLQGEHEIAIVFQQRRSIQPPLLRYEGVLEV